jgi:hypothetical protein
MSASVTDPTGPLPFVSKARATTSTCNDMHRVDSVIGYVRVVVSQGTDTFFVIRVLLHSYALNTFLFPRIKLVKPLFTDFHVDRQTAQQFVLTHTNLWVLRSSSLLLSHSFGNLGEECAILLRIYEFLNPSEFEFPVLLDKGHSADGLIGERDTEDGGAYVRSLCCASSVMARTYTKILHRGTNVDNQALRSLRESCHGLPLRAVDVSLRA